jgi:uncharacterized protein YndB with AHSA1/START domain
MDSARISTVVHVPREQVFEFLMDFEGYGRYSEYVERVGVRGDGTVGTEYEITFSWWRLSYTARSKVTDVTPGQRIEWEIVKDIEAHGAWQLEGVGEDDLPAETEAATRVTLDVRFDPGSVGPGMLDLPRFVSLEWVLERATPLIVEQAETVLRRVVSDLEGAPRTPDIEVEIAPESVDGDGDLKI